MFFFSSRRRHTRWTGDWSSDVCSSDLAITRRCRPLFVLLAVGVAKSGMSGRHLLVIAVLWFVAVAVPTWLTRGRSFSLLWSFGKRNRFVAAACTYGFLLVYQLFVIGWVIPLGVGIYRLTTR